MHADPKSSGTIACAISPDQLPADARAKAKAKGQLKAPMPADDTVPCVLDELRTNRTVSCAQTEIAFQLIDRKTGTVTGYGDLSVVASTALNVRDRKWTQHLRAEILAADGTAKRGAFGLATADVSNVDAFSLTYSPGADLLPESPVTFDYEVASPVSDTVTTDIQPILVLNPIEPSVGGPLSYKIGPAATVRCDSTPKIGPNTGGCVYPNFTPTYDVSTTNEDTAQVAWHIRWAQQNLKNHWGWQGHGPALTRTLDQKVIDDNRNTACPQSIPRPTGKSCDEYPFASTYQGASLNPDFSCHMVPEAQNRLEGSRYRRPWYNTNRLLDKDPFWVNVLLPAGFSPQSVVPRSQCPE